MEKSFWVYWAAMLAEVPTPSAGDIIQVRTGLVLWYDFGCLLIFSLFHFYFQVLLIQSS